MLYVKADEYCINYNMDVANDKSEFNEKDGLMVYNKN